MTAARAFRIACVGAVCAALTGCGKSRKGDHAQSDVDQTETAQPTQSGPKPGGHLRLPSNEPRFLNPVIENRFNRANILLFEGLVGLSTRLEPVPRLAESWELSGDGKTLTFKLRRDVKFHDGRPFSAKDVAFTYQSIKDTESSIWRTYFQTVDTVTTPDDHTVAVKYSRPYAPALIAWTLGIIPEHIYGSRGGGGDLTESAGNRQPVGTGPYKFARWEEGKLILLMANDDYWNSRPHIDRIELILDVDDRLESLKNGDLDFAYIPDIGAWSNEAQTLEFIEKFEVNTVVGSVFRLVAWNTQRAPFSDPKVRLAITHTLNRGRVIDDVLLGQARALSAPFFPNMPGADPSIAPHAFDISRAVALLDEAGFPSRQGQRFSITLITPTSQRNPVNQEMFAIFRRDLSGIGIELKVEFLDLEAFLTRVKAGQFDAAFFGWLPDIPDPDPSVLLHSTSNTNYARYKVPEVDELLEDAVTTSNPDERKAMYHKLHARLHEDLPYTVLYAPFSHYAWSRKLRGVNPDDIGSQPRFPGIARWWHTK